MGPDPKLLDDIARVAGGAVNVMSGLRQQVREEIHSRVEEIATRMDFVPREDFDQAQAMITKLRQQQDEMEKRLLLLETGQTTKKTGKAKKKA